MSSEVSMTSDRRTTDDVRLDDDTAAFVSVRGRLMGIAARILGSWAEAEDVVQDAWVRWQCCDRTTVVNPTAFLVTTTTAPPSTPPNPLVPAGSHASGDGCRNRSLRRRPSPRRRAQRRLGDGRPPIARATCPTERAAYVLHEAFDYPYAQIAQMMQTTEVNTRQFVSRARKHIAQCAATGELRGASPTLERVRRRREAR